MTGFKGILTRLFKIFDIRPGELRKTILLQLNIFICITVLLIVKPTINSLFLSELTADSLPMGYVLTAIMAVVGSYFYNQSLKRHSLLTIIEVTNISTIIILIIFAVIIKKDLFHQYFLYFPYVWVSLFGLLTASQFWILANLVYNVREAKRVFGFIGAGAIAGGIFGGYVTSIIATFTSSNNLFYIAAGLMFFCIPINRYIWKHHVKRLNKFQYYRRHKHAEENPLKLIRNSGLLTHLALIIGIGVLVAKLVDFQFSDFAVRSFQDKDSLTSFFGFWFSTLSVISLFVQLFLTKRIVGRFGVGKSLYFLPVGILFGTILLFFFPVLAVVVIIKVADGSLKQSVNKAATELVLIPISIEVKKRTKTYIDVVVDSLATGIAGFILIFFIHGFSISATQVGYITLLLIAIWLIIIKKIKGEYIATFKDALQGEDEHKAKSIIAEKPVSSILSSVKNVLKEGTDNQKIYMLNRILEENDDRFFPELSELLNSESPKIRALAIENLYYINTYDASEQIGKLVQDGDTQVTIEALRYLLKHHPEEMVISYDQLLSHSDRVIANAALIAMAAEFRNSEVLKDRFNLKRRVKEAIEDLKNSQEDHSKILRVVAIMEAIGMGRITNHYDFIEKHIGETPGEYLEDVLISCANTLEPKFIDHILPYLTHRETREIAKRALYVYGPGLINYLTGLLLDDDIYEEHEHFIPQVIEHFESQSCVNALMRIMDHSDHDIKTEAVESLRRLKWKHNHLIIRDHVIVSKILGECDLYLKTLSVIHSQILIQYKKSNRPDLNPEEDEARRGLINLLENRLDRQLYRIFHFLGIKYPPGDVDPVFDAILSGKEEQRLNAIEFLDNILEIQLKKELIPITEAIIVNQGMEDVIRNLNLKILSELECFRIILEGYDHKLKQAVIYLIEQTGNRDYVPLLNEILRTTPLTDRVRKQIESTLEILHSENTIRE
ncbi:MFS transporter [Robertkochia solimangrovi]|uniref:MFS transporter n=1 Tax=Robertkochia solimangrovi TaxID=2213046 RepID=UPI00117C1F31|nr:MFS transporter [Robertkochia solimangrovi]TRZ46071.1 hypothetical protein DMZ48_02035 [Robertkochia solimangrovi]